MEGQGLTPVEVAIARHFAPWGLVLPRAAVDDHLDGVLYARGWSLRWRWREHGSLEVFAAHRMTNERWFGVDAAGHLEHRPTPPDFYAEDDPDAVDAHRQAWRDHRDRLESTGMDPPPPRTYDMPEREREDQGVWRSDHGPWELVTLRPRLPPARS